MDVLLSDRSFHAHTHTDTQWPGPARPQPGPSQAPARSQPGPSLSVVPVSCATNIKGFHMLEREREKIKKWPLYRLA